MNDIATMAAFILIGGAATTYVWRFAGVMLAERIDPDGEFLMWVRCVATAIVPALVAGLVFSPSDIPAATPLEARLGAMAAGVACFYALRRSVGGGVAASVIALALFTSALQS